MYYHIIIEITENKKKKNIYLTNKESIEEIKKYAQKYINNSMFFVDGYRLTFDMISRFKIVSTNRKTDDIANEVRESYSRSGLIAFVSNNEVLEMDEYISDITSDIFNDLENDFVANETLDLGKSINNVIKSKDSKQSGQTIINGNVFYGNISNSNVITGNNSSINYDLIDKLLSDVEDSINNEDLDVDQKQEILEIIDDMKESSQAKKKPSIIKNAIVGLKNMLMEFGCTVTTKLIEDKMSGLW